MSLLVLFNQPATVGVSSATTNGTDTTAAQCTVSQSASSATADGADISMAQVSAVIAAMGKAVDLLDVSAAQVSIIGSLSSTRTDGMDAALANAEVRSSASSATTDSADVADAQVAPVSISTSVSSASLDGADAAVAQASATSGVSAALLESADAVAAQVNATAIAGGYEDDKPAKKKHIVKQGRQLFVFDNKQAAERAMRQFAQDHDAESQKQIEAAAEQVIALPQVKKYAKHTGSIKQFNAAQNSKHYADILAMFEQMREEEELEVLLMNL